MDLVSCDNFDFIYPKKRKKEDYFDFMLPCTLATTFSKISK